MWENDEKNRLIRNIILAVLSIAVLAGIGFFMVKVNKARSEQNAELSVVSSQRREEQNASIQETIDSIQDEYDIDIATVKEYLPGIVCWGDTLTAGTSGNISYPDVLKNYIKSGISDKYDFMSTVTVSVPIAGLTTIDWDSFTVDIPVVNMGGGADTTGTVLGRAGVQPFVVSEKLTIPADTTPVVINLSSPDGNTVSPLQSGDIGINPVVIDGIEGQLSAKTVADRAATYLKYYFTRSEAGVEHQVAKGAQVTTSAADLYKDYIHVIWIGSYGGFSSAEELIEQVRELLDRQQVNPERYIVIGLCSYRSVWNSSIASNLDRIDAAMLQEFGSHYINLRKYLCSDGLSDAGITPTSADKHNIELGVVPSSFRSTAGTVEFTGRAYELIGKLVYDRMDKLGFFDEIREELCID